jgi:hypothetical protein
VCELTLDALGNVQRISSSYRIMIRRRRADLLGWLVRCSRMWWVCEIHTGWGLDGFVRLFSLAGSIVLKYVISTMIGVQPR